MCMYTVCVYMYVYIQSCVCMLSCAFVLSCVICIYLVTCLYNVMCMCVVMYIYTVACINNFMYVQLFAMQWMLGKCRSIYTIVDISTYGMGSPSVYVLVFIGYWIKKFLGPMTGQNRARWKFQAKMEDRVREMPCSHCRRQTLDRTLPVGHNHMAIHKLI